MSLVGPRPERPIYVEQFRTYIPRYMDRHWEKGGMTGWAQVNGRDDLPIPVKVGFDEIILQSHAFLLKNQICRMQPNNQQEESQNQLPPIPQHQPW